MEIETLNTDNLIAGDFPIVPGDGTILTGQTLVRGTVVAKDSGNANKLIPVQSDHGTASVHDPYGVLAEDVDATGGDVVTTVYQAGEFNEDSLVFGGTDTADTHRDALRDLSIFLKKPVSA